MSISPTPYIHGDDPSSAIMVLFLCSHAWCCVRVQVARAEQKCKQCRSACELGCRRQCRCEGGRFEGVSESAKQLKMDLVPVPDSTPASVGGGGGGCAEGLVGGVRAAEELVDSSEPGSATGMFDLSVLSAGSTDLDEALYMQSVEDDSTQLDLDASGGGSYEGDDLDDGDDAHVQLNEDEDDYFYMLYYRFLLSFFGRSAGSGRLLAE